MKLIYAASAALLATSVYAAVPEKMTADGYVKMAGAGDKFEIESSQAVLKTTKNAKVKAFAQMMVSDHAKTTVEIETAAKASGIMPKPATLDAPQTAMVSSLNATPAGSRDKLYLEQQVKAHEAALQLHQDYAAGGDKAPLKTVATKAVPVVTVHLGEVRQLDSEM